MDQLWCKGAYNIATVKTLFTDMNKLMNDKDFLQLFHNCAKIFSCSLVLLELYLPLSTPSFSPSLCFKRTNLSCRHCSTTLVFCSHFSPEPCSGICFKRPYINLTRSMHEGAGGGLGELKEVRITREIVRKGRTEKPIWI